MGLPWSAWAGAAAVLVLAACGGDEGDDQTGSEEEAEQVESQSFVTRPDLAPAVVEVEATGEPAPGLLFLAPKKGGAQAGPLILDNDGEVVWNLPTGDVEATDFRVQEYNGEPVLTWWEGTITEGRGVGEFVVMDDSYQEIARFGGGDGREADLHEFQLTDDGTALVLAYTAEPADFTVLGGSTDGVMFNNYVQEIDIATGEVLFEWSARDHIALTDTYKDVEEHEEEHADAEEPVPFDWFHVNSVAEDGADKLLISARNTHAVYSLDRNTGEVLWTVGGKSSDFPMSDETTFTWQHDARRMPDGTISVFDNQATPATADESRIIVLDVDEEAGTVELMDERTDPDALLADSQGNAQMLDDGGSLVGWGSTGWLTEFDADGQTVLRATLDPAHTYRAYRLPWTGRPTEPPDVGVQSDDNTGDGTPDAALEVYMSWNGSTEVGQWRVLGGEDPDSLEPLTTIDKDGFETSASIQHVSHVAVEALDASGTVLGTSDVVEAAASS